MPISNPNGPAKALNDNATKRKTKKTNFLHSISSLLCILNKVDIFLVLGRHGSRPYNYYTPVNKKINGT
jgi:hypothetical protein